MGNIRSQQGSDFLYDSYNVIGEESKLKILEQKGSGRSFALREDCFVSKTEYDKAFKRVTQRNNNNQCENVIQLVKIWSKEHTGICSNLYKIFTVYEYPRVKLIDEIEARRKEKKYFEEVQLFSILQSCLNAISHDSAYTNLSPHLIFILPQGILKLTHIDLMDSFHRSMFNEQYYYSPEKMAHFQNNQETLNQLEKETIFSLGMTILHSVLLQSPAFCYEVSMKRFNYRKLEILISEANAYYSEGFAHLLGQMLKFKPEERPTFDQLQISVNQFFCKNDSFVSSTSHNFSEHKNNREESIKLATHQPLNNSLKDASLVYSGETFFRQNSSDLGIQSVTKKIKSELDLMCDQEKPTVEPIAKNVHVMSRTKKLKQSSYIDKENLYTDPKLISLIKDGIQKISKSSHDRQRQSLSVINNSVPLQASFTQPQQELLASREPFSDYQFCSEPKDKCTFVVQTYEDQSHFEGMLQNKLRNGFGRLTYPDGVYYQGNFKNDTLHGKGSLYYGPNRPAYVGDWVNNKFHGKGTLYNEYPVPLMTGFDYRDFNALADSWIKYQGQFVEDIKSGEGKIILTNGELMQGIFEKGLLNGKGKFTNTNGEVLQGTWRNNTMILN